MGVLEPFVPAQMENYHYPETNAHSFVAELCNKFRKFGTAKADESDI